MSDLSPEARQLLETARAEEGPPPGERERVRALLFPQLGVPAATARVARRTLLPALSVKIAGLAALLGVVGVGALALRSPAPPRPARPAVRVVSPSVPRVPPVAPPALPSTSPAVPAAPASPPVAPAAAHLPTPTHMSARGTRPTPMAAPEDENLLLARAQLARRDHHAREALAQLDRYVSRYPAGELRPLELVTRVLTLCDLGRLTEARAAATMLLEGWPSSPEAGRARSSCAGPLLPGGAGVP